MEVSSTEGIESAVEQFMKIGGQTTDCFNARQVALYTGLQLEEMAEKLMAIAEGCISPGYGRNLIDLAREMNALADKFKAGYHVGDIVRANYEDILDADIDLAWVALGGAFSISTNASGAVGEVARANLDKYPNGEVLRDENGKVQKPDGWRGPDLSPYVTPNPSSLILVK